LQLFSFGGYGLALVVFGAYDSYAKSILWDIPSDKEILGTSVTIGKVRREMEI